jgi:hypothetical protein
MDGSWVWPGGETMNPNIVEMPPPPQKKDLKNILTNSDAAQYYIVAENLEILFVR